MNDAPKAPAGPAGFDVAAWREEVLVLNDWARGLTIDEGDEAFATARQAATLARHAQGKAAWNDWASAMLALKKTLEEAAEWAANALSHGENADTRLWLALATAEFSTLDRRHTFTDFARFFDLVFTAPTSFEGATFSSRAGFDRATFCGDALFRDATFSAFTSFEGATFSHTASFAGTTFFGAASFDGGTFSASASFEGGTFSQDASFSYATFAGTAFFSGATFSGKGRFEQATFSGHGVVFARATFRVRASFERTTFSGETFFGHGTFCGDAQFEGATFSGPTFMGDVRFGGDVDLAQAKFEGSMALDGSVFEAGASFEAVDSDAAFSLADVTFRQVPSFIGATFKGTLRLDNVATPRYRLTLGWTPDRNASAHFRELKRRAEEAQDRDRELEFFAQEIRTGRFHASALVPSWRQEAAPQGTAQRRVFSRVPLPTWERIALPSWLPKVWSWRFWFGLAYGAFSNFGRSLWRPTLVWLALLLGFAVFYLGQHEGQQQTGNKPDSIAAYLTTARTAWAKPPQCTAASNPLLANTNVVQEALFLSASNALIVFNIGRGDASRRTYGCLYGFEQGGQQGPPIVPYRVAVASTLQTLASAILIFLFLLAVRNLLRLK